MDEEKMIQLLNDRSPDAILYISQQYGKYYTAIASNILRDLSDVEECVNDAYLKIWNSIPPHQPQSLKFFGGKIVRNLSLDRLDFKDAKKRGGGQVPIVLEEFMQCLSAEGDPIQNIEAQEFSQFLNEFLERLPIEKRKIFVRRYWYFDSIKTIAHGLGMTESKVKTVLFRIREELKAKLKKEGFFHG